MLRRDRSDPLDRNDQQLVRFIRESGFYPSCDRGHVNLYQPFLERALSLARPTGRVGLVLPWGLATDDGATALRKRLLERTDLDTLVGLDNRGSLFPVHRGLRFLVLVTTTGRATREVHARFGLSRASEIEALPAGGEEDESTAGYPVKLTPARIRQLGGASLRIPDARRSVDLQVLERLTSTLPRLGEPASWSARFGRELNATESRSSCGATGLPVLEGKHIGAFTLSRDSAVRIARHQALRLLPDARFDAPRLGYRDVSAVGNSRALIAAIVPAGVVTTHTIFCLRTPVPLEQQHFLCGLFNSFVLNTVTRLLMGGHVTTGLIEDLPVPRWKGDDRDRLIALLAADLADRPHDARTRGLLEAHVARLYALDQPTFEGLLDGFPLVPIEVRAHALQAMHRIGR
jgi:hypothetical protein